MILDKIIMATAQCYGLSFEKLGYLSYLVNGKPVEFRHRELTASNRHMIDLIIIKMKCAMGPYSHEDDPYGK
jgi:hypothetical protein